MKKEQDIISDLFCYTNNIDNLVNILYSNQEQNDDFTEKLDEFFKNSRKITHFNHGPIDRTLEVLKDAAVSAMMAEPYHKPNDLIKKILYNCEKGKYLQIKNDPTIKNHFNYIFEFLLGIYSLQDSGLYKVVSGMSGQPLSTPQLLYICRVCLPIMGNIEKDTNIGSLKEFNEKYGIINRYTLTANYAKDAQKEENRKEFGKNTYDAETILVQLCFSQSLTNKFNDFEKEAEIPTIESKVTEIEKLPDFEYIRFWDAYLGTHKSWKDYTFNYFGVEYCKYAYNKYCAILNNLKLKYSDFIIDPKVSRFFNSSKWYYFILRLASIFKFTDLRANETQKLIENKIQKLQGLYKCNKDLFKFDVENDSSLSEKELISMKELLKEIDKDSSWVRKISSKD